MQMEDQIEGSKSLVHLQFPSGLANLSSPSPHLLHHRGQAGVAACHTAIHPLDLHHPPCHHQRHLRHHPPAPAPAPDPPPRLHQRRHQHRLTTSRRLPSISLLLLHLSSPPNPTDVLLLFSIYCCFLCFPCSVSFFALLLLHHLSVSLCTSAAAPSSPTSLLPCFFSESPKRCCCYLLSPASTYCSSPAPPCCSSLPDALLLFCIPNPAAVSISFSLCNSQELVLYNIVICSISDLCL